MPDDRIRVGWEMTRQLLQKTRQVADTINAPVAVMLLPLSVQVYPETAKDFLASSGLKQTDIDLFKPQEMMKAIGENIGVWIIDLFPVFRDTKAKCNCALFIRADGHWNKLGHQIAAEEAAGDLMRAGLIKPALTTGRSVFGSSTPGNPITDAVGPARCSVARSRPQRSRSRRFPALFLVRKSSCKLRLRKNSH